MAKDKFQLGALAGAHGKGGQGGPGGN